MLAPNDNVATVLRPIAAGEVVRVRSTAGVTSLAAAEAIPLCHKIALRGIVADGDVVKYGFCIGTARAPIARGTWVHVHNVVSRRARPASRDRDGDR